MSVGAGARVAAVLVPLVFYPLAILLGWRVATESTAESLANIHAARLGTAEEKTAYAGKWLLENATFGWYDGASLVDADYAAAVSLAADHGARAITASVALALLTIPFLVWARLSLPRRSAIRHMCLASAVLFGTGICATALSLVSFKDVPVLGTVIFKYDARGILSAILRLFSTGHRVLGAVICLFSIVIPIVKLGLVLAATSSRRIVHERAVRAIHMIGKWSMADVFVMSVLIAMFAIGSDDTTDARPGPGLWFFAGYCLASIWAAGLLERDSFRA